MLKIKKNIDAVIVIAILSIAITITASINQCKQRDLHKDSQSTKGVIVDLYSVGNIYYFDYQFQVDTITYESSAHYSPRKNKFCVGDTVYIMYQKTNPNNNEVMKE